MSSARDAFSSDMDERVVFVNRCSKVVKGGRRFSFSAVVVVGDKGGRVGYGFGKANEVADAIRKGGGTARKSLMKVTMRARTVPHEVQATYSGAHVLIKPAAPGTGVIAGGGMRAVLEAAGYRDVVGKSLGSANKLNVVKATLKALESLRSKSDIEAIRKQN